MKAKYNACQDRDPKHEFTKPKNSYTEPIIPLEFHIDEQFRMLERAELEAVKIEEESFGQEQFFQNMSIDEDNNSEVNTPHHVNNSRIFLGNSAKK